MYGAILGDMIGAPYEFDRSPKTKEFPLFSRYSHFTDDSVMTVAAADALISTLGKTDEEITSAVVASMRKWGKRYPDAGYGFRFYSWLHSETPEPYGSYGNGSAMRVSSAGWLFKTLKETRHAARLTAKVTHDHPEGIKGAEATASAIYLARTGKSKQEIRGYMISRFGYDLSRTCDEIRPTYRHTESCQETVPEAITAFLEGTGFEDVIRTAVSLGGDCDTLTCIAGSIAEAFYGISDELKQECRKRLPEDMLSVLDRFSSVRCAETAKRSDWKALDMPSQQDTFVLQRSFTSRQMAALRRGNIPQQMEDKWFWYMEGDTLFAHRSWTGFCIYRIDFMEDNDHVVTVNRDPDQYSCTSLEEDAERLNSLLDWWTEETYDQYHEWLSETAADLKKAGAEPDTTHT